MAPRAARSAASVGTFPEWTRLRAVSVLVARSRRIVRPAQERAWRAAQQEQERAQRAAVRAHGRDQREARRAYQHGREADAAARRSELEAQAGELSCLLQNVLAAPPFRLEQLAQEVTVPPFNPGPLAVPVVPPRSSPAEGRPRSAARGDNLEFDIGELQGSPLPVSRYRYAWALWLQSRHGIVGKHRWESVTR
jgi:hypothetical protein